MTETPEHVQHRCGAATFSRMAAGSCPPLTGFLFVISAQLRSFDHRRSDQRLDELARPLFGTAGRDARGQMRELAGLMAGDSAFALDDSTPDGLHLDVVLDRHAGHPLILAVVLAEVGRRAGLQTGVFSSPHTWFAGQLDGQRLWLVDPATRELSAPDTVRRHCGHEVAFAVLLGLTQRYARLGDRDRARRSAALRSKLPFPRERPGASNEADDPLGVLWDTPP